MALTAGTDRLESFSPATGERLGAVEVTPPEDVGAVVDAVAKVQPFWAQLTLQDRARYLERAAQVLIDEGDDIRDLIVREQGKPRNEAFAMEVLPTIDALTWISRAGQDILADEKISMPRVFLKTKRSAFTYEPLGVIGVISPWNYPWSIPFGEVALALMAGNGVVLKPASLTPLIGERNARGASRARCSSSGARTQCWFSPTRTLTTRSPARCGAGSPTPDRRARGSARVRAARGVRAIPRGRRGRRRAAAGRRSARVGYRDRPHGLA
jgi:acyl-CoA reductase-like NAD-dependent aldehyde dehydrogenase